MKTCTKCKAAKQPSEFTVDRRRPDSLRQHCKACCKAEREARKERKKETDAARYAEKANELRQYASKYRKANRPKVNAYDAARDALRKLATPKWADRRRIKGFYEDARTRSRESGYLWHVDHIVPLKSKVVCGLHVEENLQVIPASTNQRKRNKLFEGAAAQ